MIEALILAGANPNAANQNHDNITPLTLVLLRGASTTSVGISVIGTGEEQSFGLGSGTLSGRGIDASTDTIEAEEALRSRSISIGSRVGSELEQTRVAGRRVWIRSAEVLIKSGTLREIIYFNYFSLSKDLQF